MFRCSFCFSFFFALLKKVYRFSFLSSSVVRSLGILDFGRYHESIINILCCFGGCGCCGRTHSVRE